MVGNLFSEQEIPLFDEGWWASVLEEEENRATQVLNKSQKEEDTKPSSDWERAMSLYRQDGIVELKVTGFNRGGLLVEGEGLNGFVPC
jgi:small subunit ribosomal protein S1